MVDQTRRAGVGGELDESVHELAGERGCADAFQVHGEHGGVVDAVDSAEVVVELQAVQDAWPVVEAEDVVGEQVAMPVADAARRQPASSSGRQPVR